MKHFTKSAGFFSSIGFKLPGVEEVGRMRGISIEEPDDWIILADKGQEFAIIKPWFLVTVSLK
jgi:hypothetical protein